MTVRYEGKALSLKTNRSYVVELDPPRVLRVDLPPTAKDSQIKDDHFILFSTDGTYRVSRTLSDAMGDQSGRLTLEFQGLRSKKSYTLVQERVEQGRVGTLFADRPFEDMFPTPAIRALRRKAERLRALPSASARLHQECLETEEDEDGPVELPEDEG